MAEKVTSMRLNEEDLEQFKAFAKDNGFNQQQAFNSLIALAELEKAKDVLGDRAKSIDAFRDTINRALGMYVNALEENTTAEQTIREELQKELSTKDNTITNLYDQLQEVKADNETFKENEKIKETIIKQADEEVKKLQKDIEDKNKNIDKLNSNNDLLQDQLKEYKQYKEDYKDLERDLQQSKAEYELLKDFNNKLTNENKQLNGKLTNSSDMIEFYKSNNTELKANIKALEETHKKSIVELKKEYSHNADLEIKAYKKQLSDKENEFKNKLDLELGKKDLELQKLQNQIEQLKTKTKIK